MPTGELQTPAVKKMKIKREMEQLVGHPANQAPISVHIVRRLLSSSSAILHWIARLQRNTTGFPLIAMHELHMAVGVESSCLSETWKIPIQLSVHTRRKYVNREHVQACEYKIFSF